MRIASKCKFCAKPIFLTVDDDYGKLGDPFNLIKMAACNTCADLRIKRRNITECIYRMLVKLTIDRSEAMREKVTGPLSILVDMYLNLISEWTHQPKDEAGESVITALMESPKAFGETLSRLWPKQTDHNETENRNPAEAMGS
jgi:hypothetical protein